VSWPGNAVLCRPWYQVSLPVDIIEGQGPVGLSFIGWSGGDEALLELAITLEGYCHPTLVSAD
jgi:Asp-tRNA(Asn)/Glu-tRNA(Gln) amidotransferase A subunit family amidase